MDDLFTLPAIIMDVEFTMENHLFGLRIEHGHPFVFGAIFPALAP